MNVAVFFGTAYVSTSLPPHTLAVLGTLSLQLDVTCYPVADEPG